MPTRRTVLARTAAALALASSEALVPPDARATPSPPGALAYIIWPQDGERIRGAFWCRFGLRGMGVTHAGDPQPNSGHHHLLVDADEAPVPGQPIPADKKHLHFGGGQTEARLDLPPGRHTLQLVVGDAEHLPLDPPVASRRITIEVV